MKLVLRDFDSKVTSAFNKFRETERWLSEKSEKPCENFGHEYAHACIVNDGSFQSNPDDLFSMMCSFLNWSKFIRLEAYTTHESVEAYIFDVGNNVFYVFFARAKSDKFEGVVEAINNASVKMYRDFIQE